MSEFLSDVCAEKRRYIAARRVAMPLSTLIDYVQTTNKPRGFIQSLDKAVNIKGYGLVAELKKASPSSGLIRGNFDPSALAQGYAAGGAACLSVLTDKPYFQGADIFLTEAHTVVDIPVLRKDFILDPYQVIEARVIGADAILIILAAVSDLEASELEAVAIDLDLDVLAEIHDENELERAMRLHTRLLGVNNRNLNTLQVDLSTSERIASKVPTNKVLIAESGLRVSTDFTRLIRAGIRRFLVGEALAQVLDITAVTRSILSRIEA